MDLIADHWGNQGIRVAVVLMSTGIKVKGEPNGEI